MNRSANLRLREFGHDLYLLFLVLAKYVCIGLGLGIGLFFGGLILGVLKTTGGTP